METTRTRILAVAALTCSVVTGCSGHRRLDVDKLQRLQRIAIVARVSSAGPRVDVATVEPREGRAFPTSSPEQADKALAAALERQVKAFELRERLRVAMQGNLPASRPWTNVMPAVEVATALDALLVEDRSGELDYAALKQYGGDAVLELAVHEYGLRHRNGKTTLYVKGQGRLFTLEGSELWRFPFSPDDEQFQPEVEVDVVALRDGGYRDALVELFDRIAEKLGADLSGER